MSITSRARKAQPLLHTRTINQLMTRTSSGIPWLVPGFIAKGHHTSLAGKPGSFKSMLMLDATVRLSTGQMFLGAKTRRSRVLYLDYEMGEQPTRNFLDTLKHTGKPDREDQWHYAHGVEGLDDPDIANVFFDEVVKQAYGVVVFDTLGLAMFGDENDASTAHRFAREVLNPLHSIGVATVAIDHLGKGWMNEGPRGSSAKLANASFAFEVARRRGDESVFTLKATKQRMPVPKPQRTLTFDACKGLFTEIASFGSESHEEVVAEVVEAMREEGVKITRRSVEQRLRDSGHAIRTTTLSRLLKDLAGGEV